MNIQFGCGSNRLEGWNNYDSDLDVRMPLPFANESTDCCFAEHLGEHLSGPELLNFLTECHRILKPGGTMRLCCPVVGIWLTVEHARDLTLNHGHLLVLNEDVMRSFLWMAGFSEHNIYRTDRAPEDGHFRVIGEMLDSLETCRLVATK